MKSLTNYINYFISKENTRGHYMKHVFALMLAMGIFSNLSADGDPFSMGPPLVADDSHESKGQDNPEDTKPSKKA